MKNIRLFSTDLQRFARSKNALRTHWVAPYTAEGEMPDAATDTGWSKIARYIATVDDGTSEETDDTGFYDGDGTPETTVTSVAVGYSFEGFYDPEDAAQALIEGLKLKVGEDRKVWFRVKRTDGKIWTGRATVTEIIAGSGDATEFETFSCTVTYDKIPEVTTP